MFALVTVDDVKQEEEEKKVEMGWKTIETRQWVIQTTREKNHRHKFYDHRQPIVVESGI